MGFYAALWTTLDETNPEDDIGFINSFDVSRSVAFGTQLNGGFGAASFDVEASVGGSTEIYREVLGAHVVIFDTFGKRVYEGTVVETSLEEGVVTVTADGYYSRAQHIRVPTGLWPAEETTVYQVVNDCVDYINSWNQVHSFIYNADFQVGPQETNEEAKVMDVLEKVLKFGWSADYVVPAYFAIWEHRIPYLFPEPSLYANNRPNWLITTRGSDLKGSGLSLSLGNVYNKIFLLYDDGAEDSVGPTLYPTPVENHLSQMLYGIREGVLSGGEWGLDIGLDLIQMALDKYSYPRESISFDVSPYVEQFAGALLPSYYVRAGDLVIIKDLDESALPYTEMLSSWAHNLTGFVVSTEYDAADKRLSIGLGEPDVRFEYMMGRLGLDGGLT